LSGLASRTRYIVFFILRKHTLSFNADNASPNDKQTTRLAALPNSFEEANRVQCFNHTLQLSAKVLLRPLNAALGKVLDALEVLEADEDQDDDEMSVCDDDDDAKGDDEDEDEDGLVAEETDDPDDNIDELNALDEEDREKILAKTATVRATVTKLRNLAFAIINSTTLALPVWCRI
jgi:hypothetical protein